VFGALSVFLLLLGVLVLLGTLAAAHAGRFAGFGGAVRLLFVLFLLFLLVVAATFALRWSSPRAHAGFGPYGGWGPHGGAWRPLDPATSIARERFARGEITREQFDQLMQGLEPNRGY
jgi:uncharacterized membrane protein